VGNQPPEVALMKNINLHACDVSVAIGKTRGSCPMAVNGTVIGTLRREST